MSVQRTLQLSEHFYDRVAQAQFDLIEHLTRLVQVRVNFFPRSSTSQILTTNLQIVRDHVISTPELLDRLSQYKETFSQDTLQLSDLGKVLHDAEECLEEISQIVEEARAIPDDITLDFQERLGQADREEMTRAIPFEKVRGFLLRWVREHDNPDIGQLCIAQIQHSPLPKQSQMITALRLS